MENGQRYLIGALATAAVAITIAEIDGCKKNYFVTREDKDRNGQAELYLEKRDVKKIYLLQEDEKGNVTGISEYNGLELKLGKTIKPEE